jgi:hypothetical protein
MRFFVFFLICQEMNQETLALATSALSTFMNGKELNVTSVLQAGLTLAKTLQIPGMSANVSELICKALDMLLTEALANVGESNATEAKMLAECKKCVETVLPVVLGHLAQEGPGAGAGAGAGLAAAAGAGLAAAAAAAAPAVASAEAAVAAAAVAAGVPVAVVEKVKAEAQAAVAGAAAAALAAVKTSGFFGGLSCLGCASLPVEVLAAAAVPAAAPAAAAAAVAVAAAAAEPAAVTQSVEPPKVDTPQTPPKVSETQAAVPEPQAAAPPAPVTTS